MSTLDPKAWEIVRAAPVRSALSAIRISATSQHGRFRSALRILVNLATMGGDRPAWLTAGAKLVVARGRGEFAGMLRLAPNGDHLVGNAPRGEAVMIHIAGFPDLPPEGANATPCEFDWGEGWLDITLPDWLATKPAAALAAAAPAAAKPAKPAPFTLAPGVSSHPAWASPKGRAAHEAALKGGAA